MKKIIFILICIIALITFSACSSGDNKTEDSGMPDAINNAPPDINSAVNGDNNAGNEIYYEQPEEKDDYYDSSYIPLPPPNSIDRDLSGEPAAEVEAAVAAAPAADGYYDASRPAVETPTADEEYSEIKENKDKEVLDNSVITFSLKIDSASYRNVARYLNDGMLPPSDAVRVEEMINYFKYDEILPNNDTPFSIYTELGKSPFNPDKYLAFVRVKSKDIDKSKLPDSNLTFLIDTSGSMDSYDKLPLLKEAFSLLVETLTEDDIVSIVTYAGNANIVLDSVRGDRKNEILSAINNLSAGGSTAGADGINTAYALAEKNFRENGNNRVILATDGDFNVGISTVSQLERFMSEKRESGIYLTVLGFGTENLKDNNMETIAKNGSGNYHYIDSSATAQKVLVDELSANLFTVADDVKAQVEFNPALVSSYRLIGYENSVMQNKDFNNDKKDAGEIGVGTDVVLMFELELRNGATNEPALKYQPDKNISDTSDNSGNSNNSDGVTIIKSNNRSGGAVVTLSNPNTDSASNSNKYSDELFEVRIRYKNPGETESLLITLPVKTDRIFDFNSNDFIFATSVAGFGQLLRSSEYTGNFTADKAVQMAMDSTGKDQNGYRKEFIELVREYEDIR